MKILKKNFIMEIMLVLTVLCSVAVSVDAQTGVKLGDGYTQEGIYFEVYDASTSEVAFSSSDDSIYVTREVIFSGSVKPASELAWTETIDGESYSGALYLMYLSYYQGKTTAIYEGTLYKD